jgi:16S rRNA (cytosine1402-N4)-methyltransferase
MDDPVQRPFQRRKRYQGTHPKRFEEKYKELDPDVDPETIAKVIASGKTPAGQHRPIPGSGVSMSRLAMVATARHCWNS